MSDSPPPLVLSGRCRQAVAAIGDRLGFLQVKVSI